MAATDPNLNSTTEGQICFICGSQDPQCIEDVYQWKQAKVCRAQCIIGRDIPVCRENFYWEVGRVIEFDVNSSKHCISFFDGTEWLTVDPTPMATYLKLYKEQNAAATAKQQPECQFKTLNMSPTSMIHCTPRQTLPLSPPEHNRPPASESLMAAMLNTQGGGNSKDGNQTTTTATPRLSFAASFDDPTNAESLPSPLKNIFGPSASPIGKSMQEMASIAGINLAASTPNGYEDMLAAGSPLKAPQDYGGVELNPRFSVQMEAAAAAAAAKAITSPKRTKKSPNKKRQKKKSTYVAIDSSQQQRKATIPRLWTDEEDELLSKVVMEATKPLKWPDVASLIPDRSGKQCRERYLNHLAPGVNNRDWSPEEDALIFRLHNIYGSKWTKISASFEGRSDNSCKNRYALIVRRMNKDISKGLRCSLNEFKNSVVLDRIRSKPTVSETRPTRPGKDSDLAKKIRSILPYLASVSVNGKGPPSHVSMYDFGPFRPSLTSGDQCRRCLLFAPSTQCGNNMCTTSGWCEACCNVPTYLTGDLLRECLNLRKCQDKDRADLNVLN